MKKQIFSHEYVIIGGGPAGLQMGYFFQKNKRDYVILEKDTHVGAFFDKFPIHRQLISINKVHTGYKDKELNLRWDWNSLLCDNDDLMFKNYSKEYFPDASSIVKYFHDFAVINKLNVKLNHTVKEVRKERDDYLIIGESDIIQCKYLIIATGLSKQYCPKIPGINLTIKYTDLSMDKKMFTNKRVLILGKGNSAFETADHIIDSASLIHLCSPNTVTFAWTTHFVGNLRAVNNNFVDTYHLKSQNALLDADVNEIRKVNGKLEVSFLYKNKAQEKETLLYDHVINCTGFSFDFSLFNKSCLPDINDNHRFPVMTEEWESTNLKNLYFAGTVTQSRDHKKYMSGFIHGFRYNIEILSKILEAKNHGSRLQFEKVELCANKLSYKILDRINSSSSLWQQPGFICDVVIVENDEFHYYEDITCDYAREYWKDSNNLTLITLEYGKVREGNEHSSEERPDRFDYKSAYLSKFIHPIIKKYRLNDLEAEFHLLEDLFAEWKNDEVHFKPLSQFIESQMVGLQV